MFWICTVVWLRHGRGRARRHLRRWPACSLERQRSAARHGSRRYRVERISVAALFGAAVRERRRPGARSMTLPIPRRAADSSDRAPVVVGGPVRRPRIRRSRVTTANEIHIPVGGPVPLKLLSTDVIHSFWVPNLHGKRDLIPGHLNESWLQADTPGRLPRPVRGVLRPPARPHGASWSSPSRRQISSGGWPATARRRRRRQPRNRQRGKDVVERGRARCATRSRHTAPADEVAPDLTHIASRRTLAAGTLPNTARQPRRLDRDPQQRQARQPHAADCR